jgi:hypothetical protein
VKPGRQIVKGKFNDRIKMKTIPTTPAQLRDALYLLGPEISQRLLHMLDLLFTYPLVSAEDLAFLLGGVAPGTVNRYLWELKQLQCVEEIKHHPAKQEATSVWKLSEHGLSYFAASHRVPLASILLPTRTLDGAQNWQSGVYTLSRQPRHTAGLYRLLLHLPPLLQTTTSTYQLLWMESQIHNSRRYRYQERWHLFRPDATVVYGCLNKLGVLQKSILWIEWDNGTLSEARLLQKMQTYALYLHSHEWRKFGQQAGVPYLLGLVPDSGQLQRFARTATLLEGSGITVLLTTHDLFQDKRFAGAIWRQIIPATEEDDFRTLW